MKKYCPKCQKELQAMAQTLHKCSDCMVYYYNLTDPNTVRMIKEGIMALPRRYKEELEHENQNSSEIEGE